MPTHTRIGPPLHPLSVTLGSPNREGPAKLWHNPGLAGHLGSTVPGDDSGRDGSRVGIVLAFSDSGSGEPIVFLHGMASDRTRWDPFVTRLADEFRCVAVDLPGHGESPAVGCNAIDAAVAVDEVVRHLSLGAPTVVGHSLGATIALIHATAFGPRSLVALDPVGLTLTDMVAMLAPYAERLQGGDDGDFYEAFDEWEAALLAPVPAERREGLQAGVKPRPEVVRSYWSALFSVEDTVATQAGFNAALSGVTAPALICLADSPSAQDAEVIALIDDVTVEVQAGGTHFMHLLDPDRYARRIAAWVHDLPPQP